MKDTVRRRVAVQGPGRGTGKHLPCPFCGKSLTVVVYGNGVGRLVECEACAACGPETDGDDPEQAIRLWNERP